ncbi:hypothetical protein BDW22DRAFT_632205 [Trametopsis cervina]|nr:hypothetical protein BDW22DRAFT_632205 [Trametopsis cervina]
MEGVQDTGTSEVKKLLGESVEESRAKRIEKQNARYRDRGGIFVPADTNPLLDVLLARGVNGESPTKRAKRLAGSRRSHTSLPVKEKARPSGVHRAQPTVKTKSNATEARSPGGSTVEVPDQVATRRVSVKAHKAKPSSNKTKGNESSSEKAPIAGPSNNTKETVHRSNPRIRSSKTSKVLVNGRLNLYLSRTISHQTLRDNIRRQRLTCCPNPKILGQKCRRDGTRKAKREQGSVPSPEIHRGALTAEVDASTAEKEGAVTKRAGTKKAVETKRNGKNLGRAPETKEKRRTKKRKGRHKDDDEVSEIEILDRNRPPSSRANGVSNNMSEIKLEGLGDTDKAVRGRKRLPPVIALNHGGEAAPHPPARKRPRLSIPTDSDSDDIPLVLQRITKKETQILPPATTEADYSGPSPCVQEQLEASRLPGRSKKGTLELRSSTASAPHLPVALETAPRIQKSSPVNQGEHEDMSLLFGPPPKQGPVSRISQTAKLRDQGVWVRDREPADEARKDKHHKRQEADAQLDEHPHKPSNAATRALKGKRKLPNELKQSQAAPVKRRQKENKNDLKQKSTSRKPKPRLSMFPTPAMAVDSDDEIDLLK